MKYNLVKYYSESYDALDEINKYLNREVLRKEILKDRLLSELQLGKWKPSDEMINIAVEFTKNVLKRNKGLEYVLGRPYRDVIDPSSIVGAYADSVLSSKTSPETLLNIKKFLKKQKFNLDTDSKADISLPIVSKQDIKNIKMILKTVDYLRKTKNPRVKPYLDTIDRYAQKGSSFNGKGLLGKLEKEINKVSTNLEFVSGIKKTFASDQTPALDRGYDYNGKQSLQSPYINMTSYLKDKGTIGHELTHALSGNETIADIGGAYYQLGFPQNISDKQALLAAKDAYKWLKIGDKNMGYRKKRLKNHLLNLFKTKNNKKDLDKTSEDISYALNNVNMKITDITKFIKDNNIKDKETVRLLDDLIQKRNMLASAKPLRVVDGQKVYNPEVIDILYNGKDNGWLTDKFRSTHPSNITRANEILHGLRPDLFTRDGVDKRTGKPVDFSLKGQILHTLKRAKTVGKRQFKVTLGKIKRSFDKPKITKQTKQQGV